MNGSISRGNRARISSLLLAAVLVLPATGCYRSTHTPARQEASPATATSDSEPAAKPEEGTAASLPQQEPKASSEEASSPTQEVSPAETAPEPPGAESQAEIALPSDAGVPPEKGSTAAGSPPETARSGMEEAPPSGKGETVAALPPPTGPEAPVSAEQADKGKVDIAGPPEAGTYPPDSPTWMRGKEELDYKVEFLGITMGYARLSFLGKVLLSGREMYHLRVRGWTSDLLSLFYPIDDTIDYYLDVQTMMPLRVEFTRSKADDDVATYDQVNGTIVYRKREDGEVRKKIDVLPNVYDPVSAAYYFRTRDLETKEEKLSMYAGGKVWEVTVKVIGSERIRTGRGEFDTNIIEPELRREGKVENGKEMRMWMTRDDHHVPVRLYAKFKKIRTWTLVGELLPDQDGG